MVFDFGLDIASLEQKIFRIETEIDGIRETIATKLRRESIDSFHDLNNRWVRLIPDKLYDLEGIDYKRVSFSKDVIKDFSDNPLLGARYLAALSKILCFYKSRIWLKKAPIYSSSI